MQSLLMVPVLKAEPVVGKWRRVYDSSAVRGVPPHITLLFPFMDSSRIDNATKNHLRVLFKNTPYFTFSLTAIDTFPGIIYLKPDPKEPFIALTEHIVQLFPQYPPYEGKFPQINPHLTMADLGESEKFTTILDSIKKDVDTKLPVEATATEAWLMVIDRANTWHVDVAFHFRKS